MDYGAFNNLEDGLAPQQASSSARITSRYRGLYYGELRRCCLSFACITDSMCVAFSPQQGRHAFSAFQCNPSSRPFQFCLRTRKRRHEALKLPRENILPG